MEWEKTKTYYPYQSKVYNVFKRMIDIIFCIPGLIIFGIFYIILSFLYCLGDNKGPILYRQERIGQFGKKFYMYKFRSMVVDAEERLKANKSLYQQYKDNSYKLNLEDDPRITKLGHFLRKTSIDELPQMINVLRGEMSFVGPRPIVEAEMEEYRKRGKEKEFILMKPGITGLWQSNGRSDIPYPERCDIELQYLENKSILKDINIVLQTIVKVIYKEGIA